MLTYQQVKKTAIKYRTPIAIGLTAAVTYKLTRDRTFNSVVSVVVEQTYEWGRENGALSVENMVMAEFIDTKGLAHELQKFSSDLTDRDLAMIEDLLTK